jgi:putative tryptophan/tyrosine transport system substrate-binding protein
MTSLIKRLGLGIALLVLASAILLATDQNRRSGSAANVRRVALMQHASVVVLDDGVAGVIDGLAEHGYREGESLQLTRYNPQGDFGTSSTIAREIVNGSFDLVITISTPSLQAVTSANRDRHMLHVFGLVADPFSALSLDRSKPGDHPPYMTGQGISPPVEKSFQLARQLNPALKRVGVVWNPSESNSLFFMTRARAVCPKLGIELLEASTDSSAGVVDAAQSLIARGVQAIWAGGDLSVISAIDSMTDVARKAGIPVFCITPGKPDRGTLFDIGVNYYECGKLTGALAADILNGAAPASIPIRDVLDLVPSQLIVNRLALNGLKESWKLPDEVIRQANIVVDEQGVHAKTGR